jgi:hypothetical protein
MDARTEIDKPTEFNEICSNCGLSMGSHHGGSNPWPYNYCPGHEGRMDWENGPGTTFEGSGCYAKVPYGTAAGRVK